MKHKSFRTMAVSRCMAKVRAFAPRLSMEMLRFVLMLVGPNICSDSADATIHRAIAHGIQKRGAL